MNAPNCPNCTIAMWPGRRRDKGDAWAISQEAWLPGSPKKEIAGFFTGHGKAVPVTTFACPRCGLLLSFIDPACLAESGASGQSGSMEETPRNGVQRDDDRRFAPRGYYEE
jgi:hypothetical protein